MDQNQVIGFNLKSYRSKLGLTQESLADYLGVSREEISYFENGRRPVSTSLLSKAAKLFGIDEYDFFEEDLSAVETKVALAFRADELDSNDLSQIADFRKIVLNYLSMKKFLEHESSGT